MVRITATTAFCLAACITALAGCAAPPAPARVTEAAYIPRGAPGPATADPAVSRALEHRLDLLLGAIASR